VEGIEAVYQRYQDADLVAVEPNIELDRTYAKKSMANTIWIIGGIAASLLTMAVILYLIKRTKPKTLEQDDLPQHLTPFTVHQYLDRLRQGNHMPASQREQLDRELMNLERDYFASDKTQTDVNVLKSLVHKYRTAKSI
jgi:hypothetical protein